MRGPLPIILLVVALVPGAALAQEEAKQVTPDGLNGLQELVRRAQQGALGPEVVDASFTFSFQGLGADGAIRFEVAGKDQSRIGVYLLRPPRNWNGPSPYQFIVFPDDGISPARLQRLNALLDEVFPTSPWARMPDTETDRYVPRPVGRWRVLFGFAFFVLSTIAGLRVLVRSRPREA